MTREEYAKLTPEEQRIKIAELCGWKFDTGTEVSLPVTAGIWPELIDSRECLGYGTNGYAYIIPDYLHDLNAMHEAEKMLLDDATHNQTNEYMYMLSWLCGEKDSVWCSTSMATATQRAEAFAITMSKEE